MKLHRLMNFDTDVFDGACIFSVFFFFFLEKKKKESTGLLVTLCGTVPDG